MTPIDLLKRLKAEGVSVTLKLRAEGDIQPSPKTLELFTLYRDDLIVYLAREHGDTPQMCRLSEQLTDGAVWCRLCYRYQLNACMPSEKRYEEAS